jgi:hypothetical protein
MIFTFVLIGVTAFAFFTGWLVATANLKGALYKLQADLRMVYDGSEQSDTLTARELQRIISMIEQSNHVAKAVVRLNHLIDSVILPHVGWMENGHGSWSSFGGPIRNDLFDATLLEIANYRAGHPVKYADPITEKRIKDLCRKYLPGTDIEPR